MQLSAAHEELGEWWVQGQDVEGGYSDPDC
jgi:hypothetical protein